MMMIRLLVHGQAIPRWLERVTAIRAGAEFGYISIRGLVAVWRKDGWLHCVQLIPNQPVILIEGASHIEIKGQGKGVVIHNLWNV